MSRAAACAIFGVGARTVVGCSAAAAAAAVRAGISRVGDHPWLTDNDGEPLRVARDAFLDGRSAVDRLLALAIPAACEALGPLATASQRVASTGLSLMVAIPAPRPGLPAEYEDGLVQRLSADLGRVTPLAGVTPSFAGHASIMLCLQWAIEGLRRGDFDLCLVGGVDSYQAPETLDYLFREGRLITSQNPWGYVPGEGAGFILVGREELARDAAIPMMGRVLGVGTAVEESAMRGGSVCTGQGLTAAWRAALGGLPSEVQVDQIVSDLNSVPYRADELGFTLARLGRRMATPDRFMAPADCWGDVGAATGPLLMGLAVQAGLRGHAPGPLGLVSASSEDGGLRGAALLQVYMPAPAASPLMGSRRAWSCP